ncbi:unnamed protein product [Ceratitis capitata]|uniref:(Mediterranean fruit fly) hypothetical protein n=1 Tax=Ceratitis capitata TaxID=7213 RepID=A0A811V6I0_CERCA|nr:unnamed protein product [Ceratitis capitata]
MIMRILAVVAEPHLCICNYEAWPQRPLGLHLWYRIANSAAEKYKRSAIHAFSPLPTRTRYSPHTKDTGNDKSRVSAATRLGGGSGDSVSKNNGGDNA